MADVPWQRHTEILVCTLSIVSSIGVLTIDCDVILTQKSPHFHEGFSDHLRHLHATQTPRTSPRVANGSTRQLQPAKEITIVSS
jgi:hypothetical protein